MTKKTLLDKDGNEILEVEMGFADYQELAESGLEGDYLEEQVLAVQVGPNRYRLEQNPMWTEMATFHDVVEGEVDEYGVFYVTKVVEKSGLKTFRTGVPPFFYFSDFGKGFLEKVIEAGGMWDILFWGILVFNIPEEREEEFDHLFAVACKEETLVRQTVKKTPSQLLRHHPSGGSVRQLHQTRQCQKDRSAA